MSKAPVLGGGTLNVEDEDHDTDSFKIIPRTIPAVNTAFNNSYSKKTEAASEDTPKTKQLNEAESTRSTDWMLGRDSSLRYEPTTPSSRTVREYAKNHPEQFYSTVEDEEEEETDQKTEDDGPFFANSNRVFQKATEDEINDQNDTEIEQHTEVHGKDHYGKLETNPKSDNQDTLWTEIDALDDVKNLSQTIDLYEGFPIGFEDQLLKIRESHAQVLRAMRDRNARIEEERRHEITSRAESQDTPPITGGNGNNMSRIASNATTKPEKRINQDVLGPTVLPEEDKYIQEMIDVIQELRT